MALTPEQWAEVKKAYEGGESVVSLSKRFPVSRPTIISRRNKETWTLQPILQVSKTEAKAVRERATAQVIDIATKRVIERLDKSGAIDAQANVIDSLLRMQAPLYAKGFALIDALFDKAIAGNLKLGVTQGETSAAMDLINATAKLASGSRTEAGLKDGTPTLGDTTQTDNGFEFTVDEDALQEARKLAAG